MSLENAMVMRVCLVTALFAHITVSPNLAMGQDQDPPAELQNMMARAREFTEPGPKHEILKRFLGKWNVETRLVMGGQQQTPEAGTCEIDWLMEGRWLKSEIQGTMMGQSIKGFMIIGYDNFKRSFVTTSVQSMDTSMLRSEGDLDPSGKTLITYGTLDEYLTGEHDKMVKYVWRFVDDDKFVLEVHDLPIGEQNTMVIEQTYARQQ